jgi:hypothetical protein
MSEQLKPIRERLDEIINEPANFDFMIGSPNAMPRIKELARICKTLLEITDVHQTEIARLIAKLEAVQNK